MEVLIKASQLLLSLSILVVIHELGHFLAARAFKVRVEKFYLFFNPWFSLFKFKRGDTEYGVGWLPLGGYVKIAGMIDESMDKEQMKQPAKPDEFRAKPAWQRLIIMVGGVVFNLFLAALIYMVILSTYGEEYLPPENLKYGIVAEPLGVEVGLQNGDKIIELDGQRIICFLDLRKDLLLGSVKSITVDRNGQVLILDIPEDFQGKLLQAKGQGFVSPRFPFIVEEFMPKSAAKDAGVLPGDQIVGIDTIATWSFDEFSANIANFKNENTTLTVLRDGETLQLPISIPEEGLIGAFVQPIDKLLDFERRKYSVFAAIPAGVAKVYTSTVDYVKQFRLLFKKEVKVSENLGGFITIGSFFPAQWDWLHFWTFTAFLSVVLAFMNILPIPALDGGHVMFLMYELVTRRKPNEKFMEYAQIAGMIILLSLLLFVNFNDIMRLFK
jgi:regulator of sigma E protease